MFHIRSIVFVFTCVAPLGIVQGVDHVQVKQSGGSKHVTGRVIVEAADGGVLLLDRGGTLWALQPDEIENRSVDEEPFSALSREELRRHLTAELPSGFRIHETAHYLIGYNTSTTYAEWCGALYERLYGAFTNYWKHRDFDLHEPEGPLVALVFADKAAYSAYSRGELGEATSSIIGYYSLRTNRVTMYDLTGADALIGSKGRATSSSHINRLLSQPNAERMVATIIHEATHQVAFNCGLQTRYADIPLWVSEGIAVWFETPDLSSSKGWRNIGGVNQARVVDFRRYLNKRPADSLQTLIANDERFRDPKEAISAYAEAWALNYFLFKRHGKDYVRYLKQLAEKKPLMYDSPQQRVDQFEACFGADWQRLDHEFLKYFREGK